MVWCGVGRAEWVGVIVLLVRVRETHTEQNGEGEQHSGEKEKSIVDVDIECAAQSVSNRSSATVAADVSTGSDAAVVGPSLETTEVSAADEAV